MEATEGNPSAMIRTTDLPTIAAPVTKVGWDASPPELTTNNGVFKLRGGRHQRRFLAQQAPDRSKHSQEDETQYIPELQGAENEIGEPPKVPREIPSLEELSVSFLLPLGLEAGVDLRPILSQLSNASQVVEEDVIWEPHVLLAEMDFKVNEEKEKLGCFSPCFD